MAYEISLVGTDKVTLVDDIDYENVCRRNWYLRSSGRNEYAISRHDRRRNYMDRCIDIFLHHFILGKPPTGMVVDHINGDGLDNRRTNLRIVSYSENNKNRHK